MRWAAARVASRRGSSITMRWPAEPRLVEQHQRDERGLAGAGRRDEDGATCRRGARRRRVGSASRTGRSGGSNGTRIGRWAQPRAGVPWNGDGSPATGDGGRQPRGGLGDVLGDARATRPGPSPRRTATLPLPCTNTNAGSVGEAEALHERAVGVAEHQELVGERAEELLGLVGACR